MNRRLANQRKVSETNRKRSRQGEGASILSAGGDVKADGDEENGDEAEEDNGADEDRDATRLHVPEIHHASVSWQLQEQPRRQQHEQRHHGSPVHHLVYTSRILEL